MALPDRRPILTTRESRQAAAGVVLFGAGFLALWELDPGLPEAVGWILWLTSTLGAGALIARWWAPLLAVVPFAIVAVPLGVDCLGERNSPLADEELFLSGCWLVAAFANGAAMSAGFLAAGVAARRLLRRASSRSAHDAG